MGVRRGPLLRPRYPSLENQDRRDEFLLFAYFVMKPYSYCPVCGGSLVERLIGAELRRACVRGKCDYVCWNNPIPVVAAIVELDGKIVLARNATWPVGLFSMITGFLDAQELPEQALAREVKEELGLAVLEHKFLGHYLYPAANQVLMAYWARAIGPVRISTELAEVKLVTRPEFAAYDFGPLFVAAKVAKEWTLTWPMTERS